MNTLSIILSSFVALFAGLNIFQVFSFRAYKNRSEAIAEKEQAEAEASKQSTLESRLAAIEKLYASQGEVIDALRKEVLSISKEKFESDRRIIQVEGENKALKEKVDLLEKEVQAYKTLLEKGLSVEHKF